MASIPMTDQKHLEDVEYLNYFGNIKKIMQDVRQLKSRIAKTKTIFKRRLFSPANWI